MSAEAGGMNEFFLTVPNEATDLHCKTWGGTGNVGLLLNWDDWVNSLQGDANTVSGPQNDSYNVSCQRLVKLNVPMLFHSVHPMWMDATMLKNAAATRYFHMVTSSTSACMAMKPTMVFASLVLTKFRTGSKALIW